MTKNEIDRLKELWIKTFQDEKDYVDYYFENVYSEETTFVYRVNGIIAAVLYAIPYKIKCDECIEDVLYLYALATEPEYRNKGIMTELLEEAYQYSKEKGYAGCILIPADKELCNFYKIRGYEEISHTKTGIIPEEKWIEIEKKYKLVQIQLSEYKIILKKIVDEKSNIVFYDNVLGALAKCYEVYNVKLYKGAEGYVVTENTDGEVHICYSDMLFWECEKYSDNYLYLKTDKDNIQYIAGEQFLLH